MDRDAAGQVREHEPVERPHGPVAEEVAGQQKTDAGLRADGHVLLPSARSFLAEFGGLTVVHPHARVPTSPDRFVIDALLAAKRTDPNWVREYERRSDEPALTPVGEAARGYLIMCTGPSGHVYGGYDNILIHLGTSGDDAIEGLCTGREAPQAG